MKVLFAVNDENISTSIVKKYQNQYKEIISYKKVYFFNAILKELQKNKNYDRIVISEDLEEFSSSSIDQKDKFVFDTLDNISDEAVSTNGTDIPVILICTDRRTKSEDILVKLFGIGVYNAIIGDDRSTDEVCRLINKPRTKKEAKIYYKIDSENVTYEKENENSVSESEMNNILNHFKRLGKNENKYAGSFSNIVSQYNDAQLKVIIAVLPQNVKNVLQNTSPEYRKITKLKKTDTSSDDSSARGKRNNKSKIQDEEGITEKALNIAPKNFEKNVVIPTTMRNKKGTRVVEPKINNQVDDNIIENEVVSQEEIMKKRGRPRKSQEILETEATIQPPKRRGRPKKDAQIENLERPNEIIENENLLPGFENEYEIEQPADEVDFVQESILPNINENEQIEKEDIELDEDNLNEDIDYEPTEESQDYIESNKTNTSNSYNYFNEDKVEETQEISTYDNVFKDGEIESLLSGDKKIATFVGTSKNGTSFIVNNVAQILSNMGINTAILDTTQNKSAYYIYTNDDEELRKSAINSIKNLIAGSAEGLKINNNLTIYTGIPIQYDDINNSRPILETIIKNHSIVLVDCDFNTPAQYFDKAQEIYLVQSMDVLTIQPLTEFLRKLKVKNILDERKIRIILNKMLRIKGVTGKGIVGGMANYNDPEMSFMTELFDKNYVKVVAEIPFDEDVYAKYLESMIECNVRVNGYPKEFKQKLLDLTGIIYPLLSGGNNKNNNPKGKKNNYSNSFSSGMNSTLDNMRKKY